MSFNSRTTTIQKDAKKRKNTDKHIYIILKQPLKFNLLIRHTKTVKVISKKIPYVMTLD